MKLSPRSKRRFVRPPLAGMAVAFAIGCLMAALMCGFFLVLFVTVLGAYVHFAPALFVAAFVGMPAGSLWAEFSKHQPKTANS